MQNGFITLHRKIQENSIYQNAELFHLFIHLLLNANHEEKQFLFNGEVITLKRGQLVTGRKALAANLHQSEHKVYSNLGVLVRLGLVSINSNRRFSLVTIIKYSDYQNKREKSTAVPTTDGQQTNTNNNDNNDNHTTNKQDTAALIEKLWNKFQANPLLPTIKQKYPDRDYKFHFLEMCDWYLTKKKKLPQNISAFTKWLSRAPVDEAAHAERLRALNKAEADKKQQEMDAMPRASVEKVAELREKMKGIGKSI